MDLSDPDVIRVGNDYYMVTSSFTYLPGVPLLHSKNLVDWEQVGYCVESLPFARYDRPAHGCGVWAPSIRFYAGRYYVFVPLPDEGIFVTTATDPRGKWTPLRCVRVVKGWIDPCPFWDDDGRIYLAHAFAKSRCGIQSKIQLSRLDPDTLEVIEDGPIVFDGTKTQPVAEGPKMYKRDGMYYIFIPAGGVEKGWQTVLRSEKIDGPYQEKIVLRQGNTAVNGPHQGAWITDIEGKDWFLHFQDDGVRGRILHLQPMTWKDGWPQIGVNQDEAGTGEPTASWKMPAGKTIVSNLRSSDDFRHGKHSVAWQWQANPREEWIRSGAAGLRLCIQDQWQPLWRMPNFLSRAIPDKTFIASISASLHAAENGDSCGISIWGRDYSFAELCNIDGALFLRIGCGKISEEQEEIVESTEKIPFQANCGAKIKIGVHMENGETVQYMIRNPDKWVNIGPKVQVSAGVWTGTRIGLFARGKRSGGYGIFHNMIITFV